MNVIAWLNENLEKFLCSLLFAFFSSVMIVNVFMRFVVGNAIPWASDLVLFIFAWFVMIGMSYAVKTRSHIAVTFFTDHMAVGTRRACAFVVNIILVLFLILLCYNSIRLLGDRSVMNKYGLLIRYPLWSMYMSLSVGCALSIFRTVQNMIEDARTAKTEGVQ